MKFNINLTWSKVMALLILIAAVAIDYLNTTNGTFMFALPFIVALILGKQGVTLVESLKGVKKQ